jgi:hypothetical protein
VRAAAAAALVACAHPLPDDQVCLETGYAIAARTEACTGDPELGVERQEAFEADYVCDLPELVDPAAEKDLFDCPLTLRNLACELVEDYGDDLDRWLSSSPTCGAMLDPA